MKSDAIRRSSERADGAEIIEELLDEVAVEQQVLGEHPSGLLVLSLIHI